MALQPRPVGVEWDRHQIIQPRLAGVALLDFFISPNEIGGYSNSSPSDLWA